eukprot:1153471-Pelagomonas_calceolata.AAC.1
MSCALWCCFRKPLLNAGPPPPIAWPSVLLTRVHQTKSLKHEGLKNTIHHQAQERLAVCRCIQSPGICCLSTNTGAVCSAIALAARQQTEQLSNELVQSEQCAVCWSTVNRLQALASIRGINGAPQCHSMHASSSSVSLQELFRGCASALSLYLLAWPALSSSVSAAYRCTLSL